MIKSLSLRNFGKHKHLDLTFEMITAIKGENNSGKTWIIEAFRILLFGEQFPDHYIHHGADKAEISLVFDDGREIKRIRSNNENTTILTQKKGDSVRYTTTVGVQEKVQEFTGFKYVDVDGNGTLENFNIIDVNDTTFLMRGKSSETVMRWLSSLTAGHGFEVAKRRLTQDASTVSKEISTLKDQINEAEIALSVVTNAVDWDKINELGERLEQEELAYESNKTRLENLLQMQSLVESDTIIELENAKATALAKLISAMEKAEKNATLDDLLRQTVKATEQIDEAKAAAKTLAEQIQALEKTVELRNCGRCGKICIGCG